MAVLLRQTELFVDPKGPDSLMLGLCSKLAETYGEPVPREMIEWFVDMADRANDPEGALAALDQALGPRPRRNSAMLVLGDLVDEGYLRQTVDGFWLEPAGWAEAKNLEGASPSFLSVLPALA